MRLLFAGTPAVAVPSLARLHASEHEIVAVLTREDAPLGRKRVLTPSPVAVWAADAALPIVKANRLSAEVTDTLSAFDAELGVIVAYGGLLREPLLSSPKHGWINLHFSLLPAWRGAAPVQHSLIAGDAETGASVFQLVRELDAGDVFGSLPHPIAEDATAATLLDALSLSGAELLAFVVDEIADGTATAVPQSGDVTLAPKLGIEDARLSWHNDASTIYNRFRGVTPEPGAFTTIDGARFKILDARPSAETLPAGRFGQSGRSVLIGTKTTALELLRVQPAGKQAMNAADWWRGLGPDPRITAEEEQA